MAKFSSAARAAAKRKANDPFTIPAFLVRKRKHPLTDEALAKMLGHTAQRVWAPIRYFQEKREAALAPKPIIDPKTKVEIEDLSLPVNVQQKTGKLAGSTLLAAYANAEEFFAKHDFAVHPVKLATTFEGKTVVIVTFNSFSVGAGVTVDKKPYRSASVAFKALGLPMNKLQKFRKELKQKKKLTFKHDGHSYKFVVS